MRSPRPCTRNPGAPIAAVATAPTSDVRSGTGRRGTRGPGVTRGIQRTGVDEGSGEAHPAEGDEQFGRATPSRHPVRLPRRWRTPSTGAACWFITFILRRSVGGRGSPGREPPDLFVSTIRRRLRSPTTVEESSRPGVTTGLVSPPPALVRQRHTSASVRGERSRKIPERCKSAQYEELRERLSREARRNAEECGAFRPVSGARHATVGTGLHPTAADELTASGDRMRV